MFFIVRSAVCIGLVVAALPGQPARLPDSGTIVAAAAPALTRAASRICRDHPQACQGVIGAALPGPAVGLGPRPSRDTLRPDDLRPAWSGPVRTARN